ncbi:MAG TPA: response regulator [Beijerinckiaceae bacterium]|nr:response regulator [Beijerinckiaceae bacterium]
MLLVDTLEEVGLKVDTAGSAADAINKIRLIPGGVDAAIIDIGLPDRRGDVLVKELRAIYPALPIIIAFGRDMGSLRAQFEGQRKVVVVAKPYEPSHILAALKSVGIST